MSEWYYGKGGQQEGPFDEATLRQRIAAGQVSPTDLVWREGMAEWLPLSQVAELASSGAAAVQSSPYAAPATNPVGGVSPSPYAAAPPTSGLAIASLVCGILSLVLCYVNALVGIPAVICGHMAMKKINDPQTPVQGKGMALAGLICGYIGIVFQLIIIGFFVFVFSAKDGSFQKAVKDAQDAQKSEQDRIERVEQE